MTFQGPAPDALPAAESAGPLAGQDTGTVERTQSVARGFEPKTRAGGDERDRVGRFVVLDVLGAGGMGVVYAAWDPNLGRRVALKLVRSDRGSVHSHTRMLREAQAMAQLSHPHVVAVYEVGVEDGEIWIALEYIDGQTLTQWLRAEPRSWVEIIAMFRQAGEGLAAAHTAGLVHRDFKPDNVLIGGGRARVADFGLVRPVEVDSGPEHRAEHRSDDVLVGDDLSPSPALRDSPRLGLGHTSPLTMPLTRAGALLGTPRYMAPEQFLRRTTNARTDQFAFCVALYDALFASFPFTGTRLEELAAAVTTGRPRTPPRDTSVPARIQRAILTGLAREPDDRHPDMQALLAALAPPVNRRSWIVGGVAFAAVAVGAAWMGAELRDREDPCEAGLDQAAAVWNPTTRDQLRDQFDRVAPAYAGVSLAAVDESVGAWTSAWSTAYIGACSTRHEQSAELYDLRMACLARKRGDVDELLELLGEANSELVRNAPELVVQLPPLAVCDDVEGLRAIAPPAPAIAADVARVEELVAKLAVRLEAHLDVDIPAQFPELHAEVEALDYAPLSAELALLDGDQAAADNDLEVARTAVLRAFGLATASRDDRMALEAAIRLIRFEGIDAGPERLPIARRWNAVATAFAHRVGDPAELEVLRRVSYGRVLTTQLEPEEAIREFEGAIRIARAEFGEDSLITANAYVHSWRAYANTQRPVEARRHLDLAVATYERLLSPDHPLLMSPLEARAAFAYTVGDLDAALADALRVQAIAEVNFGPEDFSSGAALELLAIIYDLRGDHREAYEQFVRVLARDGEDEQLRTPQGVITSNSICFTLAKLGEYAEAKQVCERTMEGADRIHGAGHPVSAVILSNFALIARGEQQWELALDYDRQALALGESKLEPTHTYVGYALVGIGESLLGLGRGADAVEPLARALAIHQQLGDPGLVGEAACLLARARGRDSSNLEAARAALEQLRSAGPNWAPQAEACADWIGDGG